jgi:PAS domain S-box-containing protein
MQKVVPTNEELKFDENRFIVSKTDLKGKIIYGNDLFIQMSGYCEAELLNSPHNILRHPDMPRAVFKLLWDRIQAGNEIFAYVKNLTKSGRYYWVHAYVTPMYDPSSGKIIGYHSVRRSPNKKAIEQVVPLYKKMLDAEKFGGVEASMKVLNETLEKLKVTYDEFLLANE